MSPQPSFEDHVRHFSSHLCRKYGMAIESREGSDCVEVANDEVCLRFYPGDVRDAFVVVYVSYTAAAILGPKRKSIELRRYIDYCNARDLFPNRYPPDGATSRPTTHLGLNKDYCFIGSPFLVQEIASFLTTHGAPILKPDQEAIQRVVEWIDQQNKDYTDRVSR